MPTFQRKQLRQTLAQAFLDPRTYVGNAGVSLGAGATAFFMDSTQANLAFTGERLYDRAWIYLPDTQQTFRVGSFNAASGAWVTSQLTVTTVASGAQVEIHQRLSPQNLNLCIDRTVSRFRARQEVVLNPGDGIQQYQIDNAASPASVQRVLDVYYFANANATTDRDRREFRWWGIETTGSGTTELRIDPAIAGSSSIAPSGFPANQIVMDAIVDMTLGSSETATLNIPHDEWVYAGAAMTAYNLLIQLAPGQAAGELQMRRREYAAWWRDVNGKFQPMIDRSMAGAFDQNPKNKGTR